MATIRLVKGDHAQTTWTLQSESTLLGRDGRRCQVFLSDGVVSRTHAEIVHEQNAYYLIDRDSRAGTLLNGHRLTANRRYPLAKNDFIQICRHTFQFIPETSEESGGDVLADGSVTQWIHDLKNPEVDATEKQQELWNRYFHRLVGFARVRLGQVPRGAEDEEDVAIRALCSFFSGARDGRFPELKDRHGLWQLLTKITARQAINQRHKAFALKRGGGKVHTESVFGRPGSGDEDMVEGICNVISNVPTPDFLAEMLEQCSALFDRLPDELKEIARLKLEGHTHAEIAEKIGKVERTVERKLQDIRRIWADALDEG